MGTQLKPPQLTALKAELTDDPDVRGYTPHVASGNNNSLRELLTTDYGQTIARQFIEPWKVAK